MLHTVSVRKHFATTSHAARQRWTTLRQTLLNAMILHPFAGRRGPAAARDNDVTAFREFLAELRRRRVIRALAWYVVAGWVVIQVAATVLPGLQVPQWSVTLVIVLVALGLPLAAILAWAFEFGGDRIRRTPDAELVPHIKPATTTPASIDPSSFALATSRSAAADAPAQTSIRPGAPGELARHSIAVLPFANLTGDTGKDFLGEGLAEELIHTLARVPGLRVPARTSTFAYKGRDTDVRRIAQELEVSTVLEGSVRAAGERIRITAQLINGASGYHIWSQHYDRRFEDLFELQDELAAAIILQTLDVTLLASDRGHAARAPFTRNLDAYLLYFEAASELANGPRARSAFDKLQEALKLDPGFARARSFLAHVRSVALIYGTPLPGTLADAEQDALRALDSAPDAPATHGALGIFRAAQGRWLEADTSLRRALELGPTEPELWAMHAAYVLGSTGHLRAAMASSREAVRLAPAHPAFRLAYLVTHAAIGEDDDARAAAQAAIGLGVARTASPLVDVLAQLEVRAGRYDAASRLMQESLSADPGSARSFEVVALVFDALAGRRERSTAVAALDAARARAGSSTDPQFVRRRMVLWYSMLGSYDQAFEIMHSSLDEFASNGTIGVAWAFLWMTELAGFRADPRFADLAARLRLPGFWNDHGPPDGYEWRDGRLIAR